MKAQGRSWRYFGLLALALVAGAVRVEEEPAEPGEAVLFFARNDVAAEPARCNERLDATWLGQCTSPASVLTQH